MKEKPTKEQFIDYLAIQSSGVTNMFAADVVCAFSKHGLRPNHCLYIYDHYNELLKEYDLGNGVMRCL